MCQKRRDGYIMVNENWRNRNVLVLLYTDNEEHMKALDYIRRKWKYAAILHDKDVWDDAAIEKRKSEDPEFPGSAGDPKKPHYHVVAKFGQARYRNAIADELNIAPRFLEAAGDYEVAIKYLVHANNPEKHGYDIDEVEGPLAGNLAKLLHKDDDESVRILDFLDALDRMDHAISMSWAIRIACQLGVYSDVRRAGSLVSQCIREHNARYISLREDD